MWRGPLVIIQKLGYMLIVIKCQMALAHQCKNNLIVMWKKINVHILNLSKIVLQL
jgi:hypothetical protein